jgi:predicted branched-subunit amino acid permease
VANGEVGNYYSLLAIRHSRFMEPTAPAITLPHGSGFLGGARAGLTSVFALVLIGSYMSIGALAHDLGFPLLWAVLTTLLIWAAPAQVILITALGAGSAPLEVALAVGLSSMRLLPMVVALLPLVKTPTTRARHVTFLAHLTAISMWIEALRLLPKVPRAERIAFGNGLGVCFMLIATAATGAGYYLAQGMPKVVVAALLFISPMSFLMSAVRNTRVTADAVALVAGLVLAPLLEWRGVGLDLMWTGIIGGVAAYAAGRLRRRRR